MTQIVQEGSTNLSVGFPLLGPLAQGTGWYIRSDSKYSRPMGPADFRALNTAHAKEVMLTLTLVQELVNESLLVRVVGPFDASRLLTQGAFPQARVAKAFPSLIVNRRGDYWLVRPTT